MQCKKKSIKFARFCRAVNSDKMKHSPARLFSSLVDCGKKLFLNLDILSWRLLRPFPDGRGVNRTLDGAEIPLYTLLIRDICDNREIGISDEQGHFQQAWQGLPVWAGTYLQEKRYSLLTLLLEVKEGLNWFKLKSAKTHLNPTN